MASAVGRTSLVVAALWTAVCPPAVLVGLLAAGIETTARAVASLAVAAAETVALVVGRGYPPA